MSSLLPNGKQRFVDDNGHPLSGGRVFYYIPNTSTPKDTWQDEAMTILNTNPIVLDARGECTAWGYGSYRQRVEDDIGNLIWDKLVTDVTQKIDVALGQINEGITGFIERLADSTNPDNGASLIGYDGETVKSALDKRPEILRPENFGAVANVLEDQSAALQEFFDVGGVVDTKDGFYYVTKAGLESLPQFGITPKAGVNIQFKNGAKILLEPDVDVRHVVCGTPPDPQRHVTIDDIIIDCNNSGSNGIGFAWAGNMTFNNPKIYRCKQGPYYIDNTSIALGGGRAITFQFGNRDIHLNNPYVEDCDFGCDVVGNKAGANWNVSVQGLHAENCTMVLEAISNDFNTGPSLNEDVPSMDLSGVVYTNVTFHNCGRSRIGQVNTSWTRKNTAGNAFPFSTPARPDTSFSTYDWEISDYDAGAPEYTAAATYNVGDKVRYTDDGTNSALFGIHRASGVSIIGVRGRNETSYGPIGAILRGLSKATILKDCVVNVDTHMVYRAGPPPVLGFITRPTDNAEGVELEVTNFGTTRRIVSADNPIGGAFNYGIRDCKLVVRARSEGNIGISVGAIVTSPSDFTTELTLHPLGSGGSFTGTIGAASIYSTISEMEKTASNSIGFYEIGNPLTVSALNSSGVLRLERKGSNAGYVDLEVNADGLAISRQVILGDAKWDAGKLFRIGVYRFWVDALGRLRIKGSNPISDTDGVIVGTQA